MKKLLLIICIISASFSLFSQPHQKISYQALIRNSNNVLVTSSVVGMKISILQGSAIGTSVYSEIQTPITDVNGMIQIEIGNGEGYNSINWMKGPFFIMTETDPAGGTKYNMTTTSQLMNVPFAFGDQFKVLQDAKNGNKVGDMIYWNGSSWAIIPVGQPGQFLQLTSSNVPAWSGITLPTVSTKAASSIKPYSAFCGGTVTSDGGSHVTSNGICYDKTKNPTLSNNFIENGSGTGSFTVNLTRL